MLLNGSIRVLRFLMKLILPCAPRCVFRVRSEDRDHHLSQFFHHFYCEAWKLEVSTCVTLIIVGEFGLVWFGLVSWKSIEIMTVITIDDHYGEGDQDFTYMGLNLIIIKFYNLISFTYMGLRL